MYTTLHSVNQGHELHLGGPVSNFSFFFFSHKKLRVTHVLDSLEIILLLPTNGAMTVLNLPMMRYSLTTF